MDSLNFLYKTRIGRLLLRPLISKPVSAISGFFLDSRLSKSLIKSFVKKNQIRTEDYELEGIRCFNDFFCRKIKPSLRPISTSQNDFIAPCDGLLTVHKISDGMVFHAKQSTFTIEKLLCDEALASEFSNGYCLVFRLCVNHYHRYVYVESGKKSLNRHINGFYHTVRPIALGEFPVFTENSREYCTIDTENFGLCVQAEIGAMLVGRIVNEHIEERDVIRGEEKGHFEYGGSTIIVLVKENTLTLRDDIVSCMENGEEFPIKMGESVGTKTQP